MLVVEDEALVRMLVVDSLEEAGFSVIETAHPEEALRIIDGQAIDAVVCDVGLPVMTGPQLVARVRLTRPGLPALMMTGYVQQAVLDEVEQPMAVMGKPFSPEDLAKKVRTLIDGL